MRGQRRVDGNGLKWIGSPIVLDARWISWHQLESAAFPRNAQPFRAKSDNRQTDRQTRPSFGREKMVRPYLAIYCEPRRMLLIFHHTERVLGTERNLWTYLALDFAAIQGTSRIRLKGQCATPRQPVHRCPLIIGYLIAPGSSIGRGSLFPISSGVSSWGSGCLIELKVL